MNIRTEPEINLGVIIIILEIFHDWNLKTDPFSVLNSQVQVNVFFNTFNERNQYLNFCELLLAHFTKKFENEEGKICPNCM
jgi:hypothetical protein